ncbi:hypothetical protein NXX53_06510 [Bacteroides salyersiae]|nr:hypothetical protein [Bacteroides salyersiae]
MAFYLKINGKYSVTVNNEVKRLDDKEAEFKKFRSASSAALQIIWIKRTNFKVDKYEIVPDEQPLQIDCGIQTHDIARDMICTTGAYLMPISYTDSSGNTRFAWMVTGFYEGTYRDGEEINVTESGSFLDALMPPEEEEDRTELYIIQSLQANGFKRIEPCIVQKHIRRYKYNLCTQAPEYITCRKNHQDTQHTRQIPTRHNPI